MSRADAENTITNMIRDIVRQCAGLGRAVSDNLVAFTVKAVMLDPRNGFNADRTLTQQDIQTLKELSLGKLVEKSSPSLDTIRMQVYFDMNYSSRRDFLEEIHRLMESRLKPVRREITDCRPITREEFAALYRKIVTYAVLGSGMGSPGDISTVQAATAALQSVYRQEKLRFFVMLSKREKEEQLHQFKMIVTGIRLFNIARETDFHQLMPAGLQHTISAPSKNIEKDLSQSQQLAWKYTAVLEKLLVCDSQHGGSEASIVLLKEALYNIRQHEAFLKTLQADAHLCAKEVQVLQAELSSRIDSLRDTMKSKAAVPTAKVLPMFVALFRLWSGLQDEVELLNILSNMTLSLQPFITSQASLCSEPYLDGLLEAAEVKTDEQRMIESSDECVVPAEIKTQQWLLPQTTDSATKLPLQYNGFCGYTFVHRDGLLLPGNPHIGVLKHKEKLYVFSSKEAALKFASSADDFIEEVAEKVKLSPELIQLLKLQQFSCLSPYPEMQPAKSLPAKPKCDASPQTDVHPLESNIDKSYEWNEWELRRKALRLADLRKKVTHSTQTDQSHMRRENTTQTWQPKDAACQSKRDGETNVPKAQTYLAGLRGRPLGHVVKTDLTRSVDE